MPITIPDQLPAADILRDENVFVMTEMRAQHQDVRPMKVLILNLMPKKIETENQLIRLLSNTPLQISIELLRVDCRESKNTPKNHLERFYRSFEQVKDHNYDGMIITGAPLGKVAFEDVVYWDSVEEIIRWSKAHVTSTLFLCWAVQAGLKVFYDLPKKTNDVKLSGIYPHKTLVQNDSVTHGFDDVFLAPHSRYASFPIDFIENNTDLKVLASTVDNEAYIFAKENGRQIFVTGHPEYDADTLAKEYERDIAEDSNTMVPVNYFPDDDPTQSPCVTWRSHGNLIFSNWLNYCVYQITPYDLSTLTSTLTD